MKFAPILKVILFCMVINSIYAATHHPQAFLESIQGHKDEGALIVNHYCMSCHAKKPLIVLGAPRMKVEKDWEVRCSRGFETLLNHTLEGYHSMPQRGGCFECTDKQLILAIMAMLPDIACKDIYTP